MVRSPLLHGHPDLYGPIGSVPLATLSLLDGAVMDRCSREYKEAKSKYDRERYTALSDEGLAERRRACANIHLRRKYGVSLDDYEALLAEQGGCAICGKTEKEEGRRLAVDHSHIDGGIRALLCYNCNRGLGHFQDDPELLRQAMVYLEGWKCY